MKWNKGYFKLQPGVVNWTAIKGLKPVRGKVRDVYDLEDSLLIVATDRLSAFDVVLPTGIPDKGKVLNRMSAYWFGGTSHIVDNHMISIDIRDIMDALAERGVKNPEQYAEVLEDRSMLVRKAKPAPIEAVDRGYNFGSFWEDYENASATATGQTIILHGIELPVGMVQAEKLSRPVYSPSTKATRGHDMNISAEQARQIVGKELGDQIEQVSIALYEAIADYALSQGIIICDTKLEFGLIDKKLVLIDEIGTPDSSRFWDAALYEPGHDQISLDKQYVREYLKALGWNKTYPGPALTDEVIAKTAEKYREALRRITGQTL